MAINPTRENMDPMEIKCWRAAHLLSIDLAVTCYRANAGFISIRSRLATPNQI